MYIDQITNLGLLYQTGGRSDYQGQLKTVGAEALKARCFAIR